MINLKQSGFGLLFSLLGCATVARPADLVKLDRSAIVTYIYQPQEASSTKKNMITDLSDLDQRMSSHLSCLTHVSPQFIDCQVYRGRCVPKTTSLILTEPIYCVRYDCSPEAKIRECQKEFGKNGYAYVCSDGCRTETYFAKEWEVKKSECLGAYAEIGKYSDGSLNVEVFMETNQGAMLLYTKEFTAEYLQSSEKDSYLSSEVYPVVDAIDEYCKANIFPRAYEVDRIRKEEIDNVSPTPPTFEESQRAGEYERNRKNAWKQETLEERKAWGE